MPMYEYKCQTCGNEAEELESLSAPKEHQCDRCTGIMVRVLSLNNVNNIYTQSFSRRDNKEIKPPPPKKPIFPY
jgi:putative FmdB family regulatory protein